ncbi:NifB/NifX family molybdenum-iron cluster-binding protein [Desulfosudis oleivorans]|uniref:Dinitrogenase iron-molybdenum cofactor biosynthesis protein n=1 Tax=Desulfosudis oleivorans (strain DSM 6200 / JCM 39069 / Hxd3) TaxID=96561 RepID=A8ZU79_DESOH|nr:NifB/NifX family molybdenum-iron cluster-binding protein [Desulfosudis oleivorans]ABW66391.1 Dinitrogenase iron-molybdenum cofactor biosynthesis protein [Desulfosudis oleivorans Hxd3]
MKVAVSSTGTDLSSQIDPRFGRCAYFVVVNTEDMGFTAFPNEGVGLSGGAGVQAASFIASQGVSAVLTGNCGPKALQGLSAADIKIYAGLSGSVADAVEKFKSGTLQEVTEATVAEKAGVAGGGGRGVSGGGRGMGGGGGRGMGGGGGGGRGRGMM